MKYIILLIIIILLFYSFHHKIKEKFNVDDSLYIYNNFFSINEFNEIKSICDNLKFKNDSRQSSRKTLCISPKKYKRLYEIIYTNEKLIDTIKNINSSKFKIIPDFPIEYRIYPKGSEGMKWHKDLSLFSPDCLELVLTLENKSDSKFQWINFFNDKKFINPKENDLVIVKPNTIIHNVTPTGKGHRKILKFIIQFKDSVKTNAFYNEYDNCPY